MFISVASSDDLEQGGKLDYVLDISDLAVTIIFTTETFFKMLAFGVFFHKNAYLRDGWRVLEFFIVVTSIIYITMGTDIEADLNFFRAFRALRPVRLLTKFRTLNEITVSIISAMIALGKVIMIAIVGFLMFGVIGVQLFGGSINQCASLSEDGEVEVLFGVSKVECLVLMSQDVLGYDVGSVPPPTGMFDVMSVGDMMNIDRIGIDDVSTSLLITNNVRYVDGGNDSVDNTTTTIVNTTTATPTVTTLAKEKVPTLVHMWGTPKAFNFDNIGNAMLVLFALCSFESWPYIYSTMGDATDMDMGPIRNNNIIPAVIFTVVWLLVGAFIISSLVTGVIVDKYNSRLEAFTDSANLTPSQEEYLKVFRGISQVRPKLRMLPPRNRLFWCCSRKGKRVEELGNLMTNAVVDDNGEVDFAKRAIQDIVGGHYSEDSVVSDSVSDSSSSVDSFFEEFSELRVVYEEEKRVRKEQQKVRRRSLSLGYKLGEGVGEGDGGGGGITLDTLVSGVVELKNMGIEIDGESGGDSMDLVVDLGSPRLDMDSDVASPVVESDVSLLPTDVNVDTDTPSITTRPRSHSISISRSKSAAVLDKVPDSLMDAWRYKSPYLEVRIRHFFYKLSMNPIMESCITWLIIINIGLMCMNWYGIPYKVALIVQILSDICTFLFVIEVVIKLLGQGVNQYLLSDSVTEDGMSCWWARLDVFVVIISLIPLIARLSQGYTLTSMVFGLDPTMFRIMRVFRLLRLAKRMTGLQSIITTVTYSIPSLLYVGVVLLLVLFVYSIIGMNLFGRVRVNENVDEFVNFTNFINAIRTLFVLLTGESWPNVMNDLMLDNSRACGTSNCGSPTAAPIFFVSFICLTTFLIINVFVAIVVDNFEQEVAKDELDSIQTITSKDIKKFEDAWVQWRLLNISALWVNADRMSVIIDIHKATEMYGIDSHIADELIRQMYGNFVYQGHISTHVKSIDQPEYDSWRDLFMKKQGQMELEVSWMHISQLHLFLNNAPSPLGFSDSPITRHEFLKLLFNLGIRQCNGFVHFAEIILALVQLTYGQDVHLISNRNRGYMSNKNMMFSTHPDLHRLKESEYNAGEYSCVVFIQRAVKNFLRKKRDREERERANSISITKDINTIPTPPST